MPAPVVLGGAGAFSASFASSVTATIDMGSAAGRWILVIANVGNGGSPATDYITDANVGGVALTGGAEAAITGYGRGRAFWLCSDTLPTGTASVTVNMSAGDYRCELAVVWGHTGTSFGTPSAVLTASTATWNWTSVSSNTNSLVVGAGVANAGAGTMTSVNGLTGTTVAGSSAMRDAWVRGFGAYEDGAASVALQTDRTGGTFTPDWYGVTASIEGTVGGAPAARQLTLLGAG